MPGESEERICPWADGLDLQKVESKRFISVLIWRFNPFNAFGTEEYVLAFACLQL